MSCAYENVELFRYCLRCGQKELKAGEGGVFRCGGCGFEFYMNAAGAAAAIIAGGDGRILTIERAHEPGKGTLDLPGGFIGLGESAEQALVREVREELGLSVTRMRYLCSAPNRYEFKTVVYWTIDLAYVCEAEDLKIEQINEEIASVVWIKPCEDDLGRFGFESTRRIVARYTEELSSD